ncbi:MAG TPA: hypothetical protein PKD72_08345, partial [Gemmatales bacterium]|nr:hypothetical protein [Gemmatales bacterium]
MQSGSITSRPLRNNALLWYARNSWNTNTYFQGLVTISTGTNGTGSPVLPYQVVRFNPTREHNVRTVMIHGVAQNQPLVAYNDTVWLGDGTRRYRMRINYDAILYWIKNMDGASGR